jgi:hypothetical protein
MNLQGSARDVLGIGVTEPLKCAVYGFIVFLAIILIWVGGSMSFSHAVDPNSTSTAKVAFGHGGIVLLTGLAIVSGVHAAREGYIKVPGL